MQIIFYIYSRIMKKIRGCAVRNSRIDKSSKVESGSTVVNSSFGRNSYCGYDCQILNTDIGSFTSIADNVRVGGSMHPMHFVSTSPVFLSHKDSVKKKYAKHDYCNIPKTNIGHDVWIGAGCYIKAGVTIGTGAVIGMGSVVTKDVMPYTIAAGNPAKSIRLRFCKEVADNLLALEWWNFTDEKLHEVGEYIVDPVAFIEKVNFFK